MYHRSSNKLRIVAVNSCLASSKWGLWAQEHTAALRAGHYPHPRSHMPWEAGSWRSTFLFLIFCCHSCPHLCPPSCCPGWVDSVAFLPHPMTAIFLVYASVQFCWFVFLAQLLLSSKVVGNTFPITFMLQTWKPQCITWACHTLITSAGPGHNNDTNLQPRW